MLGAKPEGARCRSGIPELLEKVNHDFMFHACGAEASPMVDTEQEDFV
jgi:hypothetical protein